MSDQTDQLLNLMWRAEKEDCFTTIQGLVRSMGWKETWKTLRAVLDGFYGERWYSKRRLLLNLFDCNHLRGFEGSIISLLNRVPETNKFEEVKISFEKKILRAIQRQFRGGGPVKFFDVTELSKTRHAMLVPHLIKAKRERVIHLLQAYYEKGGFQDSTFTAEIGFLRKSEYLSPIIPERPRIYLREEKELFERSLRSIMDELGITLEQIQQRPSSDISKELTGALVSDKITSYSDLVKRLEIMEIKETYRRSENLENCAATGFFETHEVLEKFFQNAQGDDAEDSYLEFSDFGIISYSEASLYIVPHALEEIGKSRHPDRIAILLRAIITCQYRSEGSYPMHEVALELLRKSDQKSVIDQVVDWVNSLTYEFDAEGCRDTYIWMNTSFEALEIALDICVKHHRKEIVPQLESFMEIIPWTIPWRSMGGLGSMAVSSFAKLQGVDAFNSLINRLHWFHSKWECGSEIDSRVEAAIVSIGKEVIPLLQPYLFTDWGVNDGVVGILKQLGEDPAKYYSIATYEYDLGFDIASQILLTIAETNRVRAIEELMQYQTMKCPSKISMKKWIANIGLNPTSEELVHCLEHPDMHVARGASSLALLYPSPDVQSAILKAVKLKSSNPEAVAFLMKTSGIDLLPLYVKWLAAQLTETGFSSKYSEDWSLLPVYEVIHGIAKLILQTGTNSLRNVASVLNSKLWRRRASAIIILVAVSQEANGQAFLREGGLDDFVEGFVAQIEALFRLQQEKNSFYYYPGEPVIVDYKLLQLLIDVAILNHPVKSNRLENKDICRILEQSANILPFIDTLLKSETCFIDSMLVEAAAKRLIQAYGEVKREWGLAELIKGIHNRLSENAKLKFEARIIDALISSESTTPFSFLTEIVKRLGFSKSSTSSQDVISFLVSGEVIEWNIPAYLGSLSENRKLIENPSIKNQIRELRNNLALAIERAEDIYAFGKLVENVLSSEFLGDDELIQKSILDKSSQEPYRSVIVRVRKQFASRDMCQKQDDIESKLTRMKEILRTNPSYDLSNDVRSISETEYIHELNRILRAHSQEFQITPEFLFSVASIPKEMRSRKLNVALHARLDDIVKAVLESYGLYRMLPSLSSLDLLSEKIILESLVDWLLISENPLMMIELAKANLNIEQTRIFSIIVKEMTKIDHSDMSKGLNLDTITDPFILLSLDRRIIASARKALTERKRFNALRSLTRFPLMLQSQSLNVEIEGMVEKCIESLNQREINLDLLESILKIPILANNRQVQEKVIQVITKMIENPHSPENFEKVIQLLAQHDSRKVVKRVKGLIAPYTDLI